MVFGVDCWPHAPSIPSSLTCPVHLSPALFGRQRAVELCHLQSQARWMGANHGSMGIYILNIISSEGLSLSLSCPFHLS